MRTLIFLSGLCLLSTMAANGQTAADKVENTIYKADRAKGSLDKLKGLFPKKKAKAEAKTASTAPTTTLKAVEPSVAGNSTLVSISGIDFSKLKAFNENIRACDGVQSTSYKFGSGTSTITVVHTGTTESLLDLMGETSPDIFTEKQIESFEEGKIFIKL